MNVAKHMCGSCCHLQCQKIEGGLCKNPLWRKRETRPSFSAFQVDSIVLPTVLKVRLGLGMSSPCLSCSATSRWRLPKAAQWAKLGRSIPHSKPPSFFCNTPQSLSHRLCPKAATGPPRVKREVTRYVLVFISPQVEQNDQNS